MDKDYLYAAYLESKELPYFQEINKRINQYLEGEIISLQTAKSWEDTLRIQGRIDGLKIALSKMVFEEPKCQS